MKRIYMNRKVKNVLVFNMTFFLLYTLFYFIFWWKNNSQVSYNQKTYIGIISWFGIGLLIYMLITWKKITKKWISPISIFMIFLVGYSYGQSLMWAIGIHTNSEMGKGRLFSNYSNYSMADIIVTLIVSFMLVFAIHTGATFSLISLQHKKEYRVKEEKNKQRILFKICFLLFFVSYPIVMWIVFKSIGQFSMGGYASLYTTEFYTRNTFIVTMIAVFPNSLFGMLACSKYNKKIFYLVWCSFAIYAIGYSFCGNRGGWLPILVVLCWLSIEKGYIKLDVKTVLFGIFAGYVLLLILNFIKYYRSTLSFEISLQKVLQVENSPLIQTVFEMGSAMSILLIVIKEAARWNYGNSILLSLPSVISSGLVNKLSDGKYVLPNSWLANEIIHIDWGTGFSMLGEIYLNYGKYLSIIVALIIGFCIGKCLVNIQKFNTNGVKTFIAAGGLYVLISLCRNTFQMALFDWSRGNIFIFIIAMVTCRILYGKGEK